MDPSPDLWQAALNSLPQDLRDSIDRYQNSELDVLAIALKKAKEKRQQCLEKQWKLKRSGETIVLRDVMEKIVSWLDTFRSVADVAVQVDPLHAAPAWAGIRFLLQSAVNDSHTFGTMMTGIETGAHMITRYTVFEDVYLSRQSAVRDQIQTTFVATYAKVLTFVARAVQYFEKRAAVRFAQSIFQDAHRALETEVANLEVGLSRLANITYPDTLLGQITHPATLNAHAFFKTLAYY